VVKLLPTESQIIRLVVSAGHPTLTVAGESLVEKQYNEAKQVAGALFS